MLQVRGVGGVMSTAFGETIPTSVYWGFVDHGTKRNLLDYYSDSLFNR